MFNSCRDFRPGDPAPTGQVHLGAQLVGKLTEGRAVGGGGGRGTVAQRGTALGCGHLLQPGAYFMSGDNVASPGKSEELF